ncbi:MAG: hypothetical protein HY678_06990 [Chloroflexi bacterium]|nr:hypothetical protein [Chloroflexota bacterium]
MALEFDACYGSDRAGGLLDVVATTSGLALAVIVLAVGQLTGSGAFRIGR